MKLIGAELRSGRRKLILTKWLPVTLTFDTQTNPNLPFYPDNMHTNLITIHIELL
jgi:hypothetical protein